jgi:hypothetical protein
MNQVERQANRLGWEAHVLAWEKSEDCWQQCG